MTVLEEKKSGATGATPERHGSDIGSDRSDMGATLGSGATGATWEQHGSDIGERRDRHWSDIGAT